MDFDEKILEALPNSWSHEHNRIRIDCDDIHKVIDQLTRQGANLSGMSIGAANLEDVFLRLTGRQLRE